MLNVLFGLRRSSLKIHVNREGAGWILDRIHDDYSKYSRHEVVARPKDADFIWCLNMWGADVYRDVDLPKVATVHHINHYQGNVYCYIFEVLKEHFMCCIVPNRHTAHQIPFYDDGLSSVRLPYWLLSDVMYEPHQSSRLSLPEGGLVIGSFQKDSNGDGTMKKVKGPDLFADVVEKVHQERRVLVLLGGYRRTYLQDRLKEKGIPFLYSEMYEDLSHLYSLCDWYLVTSRQEGGPQAVLEASYHKVKIASTDVGMASAVLHEDCIAEVNLRGNDDPYGIYPYDFDEKTEVVQNLSQIVLNDVDRREENYQSVQDYLPEVVVPRYDDFFEQCREDYYE